MPKPPPHFITGHKNPDADSVVSVEVLAWLYGATSKTPSEVIPIQLGPLNRQTRWPFKQAGRTPPILRKSCLYSAEEIARPVPFVHPDSPLREALQTMQRSSSDFVVVPDVLASRSRVMVVSNDAPGRACIYLNVRRRPRSLGTWRILFHEKNN